VVGDGAIQYCHGVVWPYKSAPEWRTGLCGIKSSRDHKKMSCNTIPDKISILAGWLGEALATRNFRDEC
jgi:hypothetical protein